MKFNITIEKDDEGRYVAECPDLPGCISEGETLEDALENINEAIIGCMKSGSRALQNGLRPHLIAGWTYRLICKATYMCKLPRASGEKHLTAFRRASWTINHIGGSHYILVKEGSNIHLSI